MPQRSIFALFALICFVVQSDCFALADKLNSVLGTGSGTWLATITTKSSQDMNFQENPEFPEDAGGNPLKFAVVFCNDEKLKEEFKKITGPNFFSSMQDIKNKYGSSIYIVVIDVVPSATKDVCVKPADDDLTSQKIYNNTKFIVGYASYQTPGDHWIDIPLDDFSATIRFDKNVAVLEPKVTEKK